MGQRAEAALGRGIGIGVGLGLQSARRGDVDHARALAPAQQRQRGAGAEERGRQGAVDPALPRRQRQVLERAAHRVGDTGIVDETIDPVGRPAGDPLERALHRPLAADVAGHRHDAAARQHRGQFAQALRIAVESGDTPAQRGEVERGAAAYAGGGPGDDDGAGGHGGANAPAAHGVPEGSGLSGPRQVPRSRRRAGPDRRARGHGPRSLRAAARRSSRPWCRPRPRPPGPARPSHGS